MNEEINEITLNEIQEENIIIEENTTLYDVCKNINLGINLIFFTIIIIFLYKYLKTVFKPRK